MPLTVSQLWNRIEVTISMLECEVETRSTPNRHQSSPVLGKTGRASNGSRQCRALHPSPGSTASSSLSPGLGGEPRREAPGDRLPSGDARHPPSPRDREERGPASLPLPAAPDASQRPGRPRRQTRCGAEAGGVRESGAGSARRKRTGSPGRAPGRESTASPERRRPTELDEVVPNVFDVAPSTQY